MSLKAPFAIHEQNWSHQAEYIINLCIPSSKPLKHCYIIWGSNIWKSWAVLLAARFQAKSSGSKLRINKFQMPGDGKLEILQMPAVLFGFMILLSQSSSPWKIAKPKPAPAGGCNKASSLRFRLKHIRSCSLEKFHVHDTLLGLKPTAQQQHEWHDLYGSNEASFEGIGLSGPSMLGDYQKICQTTYHYHQALDTCFHELVMPMKGGFLKGSMALQSSVGSLPAASRSDIMESGPVRRSCSCRGGSCQASLSHTASPP